MSDPPLLELVETSVRFGGHVAVDRVSMKVQPGTITGLIGPNGAGKTTAFNVITGLQPTSGGRVLLSGQDITGVKAHKRAQQGIARTFQRLEVFGSLTARENVLVAVEVRRMWGRKVAARPETAALLALMGIDVHPGSAENEADAIVDFVGAGPFAETRADELPTGLARLVELGRALAIHPRLLLLDEPASGQDESETQVFARLLENLARAGLGVLLVEHDVPFVMQLCSEVNVLDFGSILASGTPAEVQSNQKVLDAYLGADSVDSGGTARSALREQAQP